MRKKSNILSLNFYKCANFWGKKFAFRIEHSNSNLNNKIKVKKLIKWPFNFLLYWILKIIIFSFLNFFIWYEIFSETFDIRIPSRRIEFIIFHNNTERNGWRKNLDVIWKHKWTIGSSASIGHIPFSQTEAFIGEHLRETAFARIWQSFQVKQIKIGWPKQYCEFGNLL